MRRPSYSPKNRWSMSGVRAVATNQGRAIRASRAMQPTARVPRAGVAMVVRLTIVATTVVISGCDVPTAQCRPLRLQRSVPMALSRPIPTLHQPRRCRPSAATPSGIAIVATDQAATVPVMAAEMGAPILIGPILIGPILIGPILIGPILIGAAPRLLVKNLVQAPALVHVAIDSAPPAAVIAAMIGASGAVAAVRRRSIRLVPTRAEGLTRTPHSQRSAHCSPSARVKTKRRRTDAAS